MTTNENSPHDILNKTLKNNKKINVNVNVQKSFFLNLPKMLELNNADFFSI